MLFRFAVTDSNSDMEDENSVEDTSLSDTSKKIKSKKKKVRKDDVADTTENQDEEKETETFDLSNMTVSAMKRQARADKSGDHGNQKKRKHRSETMRYDPYPGPAPVSKEAVKKYKRGSRMDLSFKTKFHSHEFKRKEKKLQKATKQAARAEFLLPEDAGFIEADDNFQINKLTQHDIAANVDIMSAQKYFELNLDKFGPYKMNYTRNGRQLLIGGAKGHVAAIDWQSKRLMCELNVMETVQDVKWLHIETMYAVAQKQWTYIYDNKGIELHCLKTLDQTLRLEFLPYHFLLVAANARGFLSYIDVSIGQKVVAFPTGHGRLDVMCQNPHNAIIHLGHAGGTVTLWSPNSKEPLVKMLCHGGGTRSIAVNKSGEYMVTSGIDRTMKVWDLRMYKMLQSYKVAAGAGHLAFSQQNCIGAGMGNVVEIYKDCINTPVKSPYLSHRCPSTVANLQFCPYEDVLGVGHGMGFSSLLVPGCGEANFDALEANPYQTKKQRQQAEVKMLLEKVQPEMISLDTSALGHMDVKSLQQELDEKKKLLWIKPKEVDFEPRYKMKGGSKASKKEKRRQGMIEEKKREEYRGSVHQKDKQMQERRKEEKAQKPYSVFDRFKRSDT